MLVSTLEQDPEETSGLTKEKERTEQGQWPSEHSEVPENLLDTFPLCLIFLKVINRSFSGKLGRWCPDSGGEAHRGWVRP